MMSWRGFILLFAALFCACSPRTPEVWGEAGMEGENYVYITNGKVQLGVDIAHGGSIFHFSTASEKVNRLNHADEGRFIQQSYYGRDGKQYFWSDDLWGWNPIQGGGADGTPSKIKSVEKTDSSIKVVSVPKQWGRSSALRSCRRL